MNSYFDQQWDQQLAGRPQALAAFSSLDSATQEKIVGYIQSCDDTWEADRRKLSACLLLFCPENSVEK